MEKKIRVARRSMPLALVLAIIGVSTWLGVRGRGRHSGHSIGSTANPVAGRSLQPPEADGMAELMGSDLRGKPAPGFRLNDIAGRRISLADFKGHAVVLNFWATYCGPCKLEMRSFQELEENYRARGLVILGIDEDGDLGRNEIAAAAKHLGVTYPILMPDHTVSKKYGGVDYLPETFYVDRNGTIVAQAAGARTKDQIEMSIRAALGSGT